jgi:DNA-binding transcriptional regulator YiaG
VARAVLMDLTVALNEMVPERRQATAACAAFAFYFKRLRTRLLVKQANLSYAMQCTEAAVSYWESGQRLPQHQSLLRILLAFSHLGATQVELDELAGAWQRAAIGRAVGASARLP